MKTNWKTVAGRRVVIAFALTLTGIAAIISPAADRMRTQQWIHSSITGFNQGRDPDFTRGMRLISISVTSSQCQAINDLWKNLTTRWDTLAQERSARTEVVGIGLPLPINLGLNLASSDEHYLPLGAQAFRSVAVSSCPRDMTW